MKLTFIYLTLYFLCFSKIVVFVSISPTHQSSFVFLFLILNRVFLYLVTNVTLAKGV